MFTTFIVQPIFNLFVLIYALIPGHNFGLALIIFTIIIRLILWPLLKKQLHQTKAIRKLQPDIKRIKEKTKGNRQQESVMLMELYKERGINPFATFPILIFQAVILIGLYTGLRRVIENPDNVVTLAYPLFQHLGWMQQLAHNIHLFDNTLFGFIDLSKTAFQNGGGIYLPALLIALGSAVAQYFQAAQLMVVDKNSRTLRQILKDAGKGVEADQSEMNAAFARSTRYLLPVMIFIFAVNLAAAAGLYLFVGAIVAYIQQSILLRQDETEMEAIADGPKTKDTKKIPEAVVVSSPTKSAAKKAGTTKPATSTAKPKKSPSKSKKTSAAKKKRSR